MSKSEEAVLVGIGKMGILYSRILSSIDVVKLQAVTEEGKRIHLIVSDVINHHTPEIYS